MPGQGGRDEVKRGRPGMESPRWMEANTETRRDTETETHRAAKPVSEPLTPHHLRSDGHSPLSWWPVLGFVSLPTL